MRFRRSLAPGLLGGAVALAGLGFWVTAGPAGADSAAGPFHRVVPGLASDEGFGTTLIVQTPTAIPTPALQCEQENWPVKRLADADAKFIDFVPQRATVADLIGRRRPFAEPSGSRRADEAELSTYRLTADLVFIQLKEDGDIHLVLADPATGQTMITEFIDIRCPGTERSLKKPEMLAARTALEAACGAATESARSLQGAITMVGVGFWDTIHPERGAAPNGVELHPALSVESISCARAER